MQAAWSLTPAGFDELGHVSLGASCPLLRSGSPGCRTGTVLLSTHSVAAANEHMSRWIRGLSTVRSPGPVRIAAFAFAVVVGDEQRPACPEQQSLA